MAPPTRTMPGTMRGWRLLSSARRVSHVGDGLWRFVAVTGNPQSESEATPAGLWSAAVAGQEFPSSFAGVETIKLRPKEGSPWKSC